MVTRWRSVPGNLLFGKTRQAVLGLLFTRPDETFHLRQIVRLTGAGLGPVQREVGKLAAANLVLREQRGRQVFYAANSHSPVYPELRGLVIKTAGLVEVLRSSLLPLEESIQCAFIFGSFAQGEHGKGSDVDVLVIGDAPFAGVARALAEPQRKLAREINLNVYTRKELAKKLAAGHHFLTRVLAGAKLLLVGDEHELFRMAEERVDSPAPKQRAGNRRTAARHRPRRGGQRRSED